MFQIPELKQQWSKDSKDWRIVQKRFLDIFHVFKGERLSNRKKKHQINFCAKQKYVGFLVLKHSWHDFQTYWWMLNKYYNYQDNKGAIGCILGDDKWKQRCVWDKSGLRKVDEHNVVLTTIWEQLGLIEEIGPHFSDWEEQQTVDILMNVCVSVLSRK